MPWAKVLELLAVNRLLDPRSELFVHEKWFPQTAMDVLLDCDSAVAHKDRLYRCLDRIVEHKGALEQHLAAKWRDLFGASFDIILYDLTSTYFEGGAQGVEKAKRGYSRDHCPDCKQLDIALVVTAEGLIRFAHPCGAACWLSVSLGSTEDNLQWLRERGACYLVGTPKPQLNAFEQHLTDKDWQKASSEVEVKLCPNDDDVYVLCRSQGRVQKEQAMRRRVLKSCVRDLIKLKRSIARGTIKDSRLIAHLEERHRPMWCFLKHCRHDEKRQRLDWEWNREKWQAAVKRDGAYLLRAHWPGQHSAAELWQTYVQLAPFASSGSVGLRPAFRQPISRLPPALGSPRPKPR